MLPQPLRDAAVVCAALLLSFSPAAAAAEHTSGAGLVPVVASDDAAPCIQFAAGELRTALAKAGVRDSAVKRVEITSLDDPRSPEPGTAVQENVPQPAESFLIRRAGDALWIVGRDAVGTMYGTLEVAESVAAVGSLDEVKDSAQQPFLAIRAVNQFLFEEALKDPHSWFYRDDFWEGYFAMLARSRTNVLDLHAGYGLVLTNFPNIFPYFVYLPEFPAQCVGRAQAERNMARLNRIVEIGRRHGVNVALMNYTVQGRKQEEKSELFEGFDAARLTRYMYLASRALLEQCPHLWMYGFRIGESGQPEDFFQNTYLKAVADSGYKGKLFTRSWLATRQNIERIKHGFPGDFYIEVKYNGERLGPPYQAITTSTDHDASYSYEAYTDLPRDFKLLYQVRANGTHRIFHWGDPEFVARVAKSCRLGDSAGYSVEPMTAYYPMTDEYHPKDGHHYFTWTWQRDWFWYQLWGRLGYDPDLDRATFVRMFEERFGPGGGSVYELYVQASRVVSFIESALTLGPDHRHWAPEFETGDQDFSDLGGLRAYENLGQALDVPPFDPTVMCSLSDAAAQELAGKSDGRMGARTDAERLFRTAAAIDRLLAATPAATANRDEAECIRTDARALACLARFAAERYLAGLELAEYNATSYPPCLASARHHLRWAREYWRQLAEIADAHYAPLLETIRMRTHAYRWASQLKVLDADLGYLASLAYDYDIRFGKKVAPRMAHLPATAPELMRFEPRDATWPVQWRESAYVRANLDGRPALFARGGTVGFDVDDLLLDNVDADVAIAVSFYDPGPGTARQIAVKYDRAGLAFGDLAPAGEIRLGGSKGWHTTTFQLPHARFAGGGPGFSDIVFSSSDGADFSIDAPALTIVRPPAAHLDVDFPFALKLPPKNPVIHWRTPGASSWQQAPLVRGIGEQDMEAAERGRELYRFQIPANTGQLEYYFTADWRGSERRLPEGNAIYHWTKQHEPAAPTIVSPPLDPAPRRAGAIEIAASVSSPDGVGHVEMFYKPIPTQYPWQSIEMKNVGGGRFVATVPLTPEGLLYRFRADDRSGAAAVLYPNFEVETPYRTIPSWNPADEGRVTAK